RLRIIKVLQAVAEIFQAGNLTVIDVVVNGVPVLCKKRDIQQRLLGQVGNRDHQQGSGCIADPRVMTFKIWLFPRQVDAVVTDPNDSGKNRIERILDRSCAVESIDIQLRIQHVVPGGQIVRTGFISEEELCGVKACSRWEGTTNGRT